MSLAKLIDPRSIAIVGISTKNATFQVGGRAVFDHLRRHGYAHRIDLITRQRTEIEGVATVTDLAELPSVPDCLLVSVPADDVCPTIARALELGVRAFVVVTGGFSEAGAEGAVRQRRLVELVAPTGAALLGPNTTGFVNFGGHVAMSSTSRISAGLAPVGGVGLVIQSGALGSALIEQAERNAIGLSHLISTGNEAVSDLADFVDYLVDDPATKVIALYVEGFRRPDKVVAAARRAHAAGKPIVLYKTGRSDAGRRAAAGHTGALIGARRTYEAAARQLGWVDVAVLEDLLPVANYLALARPARTMGILTVSGGFGGCVADALDETGSVTLPEPAPETVERMRPDIPPFLSTKNPVDIAGTPFRRPDGFADCLDAFADDPAFDALAVANTPIVPPWGRDVTAAVRATHARTGKTISVVWPAEIFNGEALSDLRAAGIPVFTRVDTFARAVAGAAGVDEARRRPSRLLREGIGAVAPVAERRSALDEAASKGLLRELGLSFPRERFVPAAERPALAEAAAEVGWPATLKGIAPGVVHKSELGLVAVGLAGEAALAAAAEAMAGCAARHGHALSGFLVGETARPKAEVILGLSLDPEFGPVLTFGAGGIYTEVLQDAAVRLLPLDEEELRTAIRGCRIGRIVEGARGRPPLDLDALVALAERIAGLAPQLGGRLQGLELNPVGVGEVGEGVWILDASVFVPAAGDYRS